MGDNLLNIKIGGKLDSSIIQSSKEAAKAVDGIGKSVQQVNNITINVTNISKVGKAAREAGEELDGLGKKARGAGDALGGIGGAAAPGIKGAMQSIQELEDELDELQRKIRKATSFKEIDPLVAQYREVERMLNNTNVLTWGGNAEKAGKAAGSAAGGLSKLKKSGQDALPALTDINRVIQDMPFGFVAIQNNLTQLPQSFGALRAATGSTGGAFKALLGSLTGVGGIGFALSLVTSAVTLASVGFSAWTRGFGSNKKAIDEAKEAAEEYAKAIDGIRKSIADEATRVSVLVTALKNETLSRDEKKQAILELKKINPQYFKDLKDEKGFIDQLTNSYFSYINSLKTAFEAKAVDKQLETLFDKKLKIEAYLDTKVNSSTNKQISELKAQFEGELAKLGGLSVPTAEEFFKGNITEQQKKVFELQQLILKVEKPITLDFANATANKQLAAINKEIDGLLLRRSNLGSTALGLKPSSEKSSSSSKEDEQLKQLKDQLQGYQKQLEVTNKLREAGILPLNRENDALDLQLKILQTLAAIDAREVAIKAKPRLEIDPELADLEVTKVYKEFSERSGSKLTLKPFFEIKPIGGLKFDIGAILKDGKIPDNAFDGVIRQAQRASQVAADRITQVAIDTKSLITSNLSNAFSSLGEGIAAAIQGGGLEGLFGPLIATIGDAISSLGKAAIEAGTTALLLKTALQSFIVANPALVIAAGVAAVAIGSVLKTQFQKTKVPKFAEGGIATGPTFGLFGEAGTEAIIPLRKLPDLVGQMTGGGANVTLQPSIVFSGAGFQVMLREVDRRRRQLG